MGWVSHLGFLETLQTHYNLDFWARTVPIDGASHLLISSVLRTVNRKCGQQVLSCLKVSASLDADIVSKCRDNFDGKFAELGWEKAGQEKL